MITGGAGQGAAGEAGDGPDVPAAEDRDAAAPVRLPEPARERVVRLAADRLGTLPAPEVPAALRPFVRFTPARRARLAAVHLAAALETDGAFRVRVAESARAELGAAAAAVDAGILPAAVPAEDAAALAYLLRPAGWRDLVDAAAAELERTAREAAAGARDAEVAALREALAAARADAAGEVERLRAEVALARGEAEAVRRQVREAADRARRAEVALRDAEERAAAVALEARTAAGRADAELRRLRARLAEAEAAAEAARRVARDARSDDEQRLRLLLDTLLGAAQGLRRELALAPVDGRPADHVEGAPVADAAAAVGPQGEPADDPALLDRLLALPQVHLVVDGYNVTRTGYGALPLRSQRERLLAGLGALAARTGAEVTCAFDGAGEPVTPAAVAAPRGVRVLFSRGGESADDLVRRLVHAEPRGRPVVVVSSDREVVAGAGRAGARAVPAVALLRRLDRA